MSTQTGGLAGKGVCGGGWPVWVVLSKLKSSREPSRGKCPSEADFQR